MKRLHWAAGFLLFFSFATLAKATPISFFDDPSKNAQMMEEAALTGYAELGDLYGTSIGNTLDLSGAVFSAAGFSFSLTGTYQGMAVDESFTGSYDAGTETGSYTATGTVGTDGVTGAGSWSWADASATEEDLSFSTSTASVQKRIEYDTETGPLLPAKAYYLVGRDPYYDYVVDLGIVEQTKEGNLTGVLLQQYSQEIWPRVPPPPPPQPPPPTGGVYAQLGDDTLEMTADVGTGTATGSVTTVPEPGTWMLVGMGIGACGWMRRRLISV